MHSDDGFVTYVHKKHTRRAEKTRVNETKQALQQKAIEFYYTLLDSTTPMTHSDGPLDGLAVFEHGASTLTDYWRRDVEEGGSTFIHGDRFAQGDALLQTRMQFYTPTPHALIIISPIFTCVPTVDDGMLQQQRDMYRQWYDWWARARIEHRSVMDIDMYILRRDGGTEEVSGYHDDDFSKPRGFSQGSLCIHIAARDRTMSTLVECFTYELSKATLLW